MALVCVAFILVVLVCGEILFSLLLPRLSARFEKGRGSLSPRGLALWVAGSWLFGLVTFPGYVVLADRFGTDLWLLLGFLAGGLVLWLVSHWIRPRKSMPREGRLGISVGFFLAVVSLLLFLLVSRWR